MLQENYRLVENNVANACKKSGRERSEVTLIAVSKTKPLSDIEELIPIGVKEFGENKVQELKDKFDEVSKPVNFHMIGHLQTNKIKYLIGRTCLIHSVDSIHLAEAIEKEAAKKDVNMDILLEVNVAEEDTKFGLKVEEVLDTIMKIKDFPHVHIKGLMTIAPFVSDPEENRVHFRRLRDLSLDIKSKNIDNVSMCFLSMGMTNDYMVAIEEGATHVRVGTGIFGERNYEI